MKRADNINKRKSITMLIENSIHDFELDLNGDTKFSIFEIIIIILISIVFGIVIGYIITYTKSNSIENDENLTEIISAYNTLKSNYYKDIDDNTLSNAAIKGMINSLDDPYSNYLDEESATSFNESIDGFYVGIGVTVSYEDGKCVIILVNENGPAAKAGLKVNDIIVSVDGKRITEENTYQIIDLIKGDAGTKVNIKVLRGNKEKSYIIVRKEINIESVFSKYYEVDSSKIGYIKIKNFASNTYSQFKYNLESLEKKNINRLIIDVRGNPGGHLSQTNKILSMFFTKKTILYKIKDSSGTINVNSNSKDKRDYPIVIMIDGGSASASEILASCFKDNYNDAIIVGTNSYGKGSVQKSQNFSSGISIKYTTEQWLTSKGKSIDGKGIKPDYEIKLNEEYYSKPSFENDNQMQLAISKLK